MNNGDAVKLWDLKQAQPTPVVLKGDKIGNMDVAISPDGKWVAVVDRQGNPALWELARLLHSGAGATGAASLSFPVPQGEVVGGLAFSPDGKALAATVGSSVMLWEIGVGGVIGTAIPSPTVVKEDEQITYSPYTLTWKWSRFGEDFGEVKAPPPQTVNTPIP
jgi:WD40 repeat protein